MLYRWLKLWNIQLESEAKERALANKLVGSNLKCEMVMFTFTVDGGEEIRKAPMAYIPDLVSKVKELLDQNDR
jgi:ribosomal protein S6E (S10)